MTRRLIFKVLTNPSSQKLTKFLKDNDQISLEKKQRFVSHTAEVILENTFVNGVDNQSLKDAQEFVMSSMDILTDDSETLGLLKILSGHDDFIYAHSLGVSVYSTLIAKKMGWRSSALRLLRSRLKTKTPHRKKHHPRHPLGRPRLFFRRNW